MSQQLPLLPVRELPPRSENDKRARAQAASRKPGPVKVKS